MIIIKIFKDNALYYAGKAHVIDWKKCIKHLKIYFPDIVKIENRIKDGDIIDTPYSTFQKDRRNKERKVDIERRRK